MNLIYGAPLWVQEVIYMDIKNHVEENLPGATTVYTEEEIYPIYVPEITFKGKKELETHDHAFEFNVYKLLEEINKGQRIADITLNNFWSLEQTSAYLALCVKNELVKTPSNPIISASIFYLGNEIRLGEYVKRLDKIDIQGLDDILRKQKLHNEENPDDKVKIGELLINMGYVANKDIDKILNMKQEAKRRFIVSNDFKPAAQSENVNYTELQQKIQKLTTENNLLKDKLRAIFNIQNKKKTE